MTQFKVYDVTPYQDLSPLQLLKQFHDKFGTPYDGEPRMLDKPELAFRLVCHDEEANEYLDAVERGDLVEVLDATVDEIYFLTGTAHRQGFMDLVIPSVDMQPVDVGPRLLPMAAARLRQERHNQVLNQYAVMSRNQQPLWQQKLALKEALNCFYRTAALHGFDIHQALLRVHAANMAKDIDPTKQRRTKALAEQGIDAAPVLEITKPAGWLAPYLGDLVGQGPYQEVFANEDTAVEEVLEEMATIERGFMRMKTGEHSHLCGLVTIDGPDASGKTTLAKRIAEVTGGQVVHLTWSPQLERVMNDYRTSAIRYAAALSKHCVVVLERPWLSHPVYAEVYRKGKFDDSAVVRWKADTEFFAALNLFALPGDQQAWLQNYLKMCNERDELHGPNEGKAMAVYSGFRDYFSGVCGPDLCPNSARLEVYDFQRYTTPVDIDQFIADHVLPQLNVKA